MAVRLIRDLPNEHLTAIGRAITNFSGLDVTIELAIARVLNVHAGAHAALTVGLGTDTKLEILQNLATTTLAKGPVRSELLELVSDAKGACVERNFIAHAHWLLSEGTRQKTKIYGYLAKKNKAGVREEVWIAQTIEEKAASFLALESKFLTWLERKRLRRKHVSWHERHLPPSQQNRPLGAREFYFLMQIPPHQPSRE